MKLLCVLLVCFCLSATVRGQRKNVILLLGEGAGRLMGGYNHTDINTPNLDALAASSLLFTKAYASDCSSSPERAAILTGMPGHQNGMYGQSDGFSHFSSFDNVPLSLPALLRAHNIRTGYIGRKNVQPNPLYKFDFEATEDTYSLNQIGRNITLIKNLVHQFLNGANSSRPFFLIVSFNDPSRCSTDQERKTYGEFCEKMGNGQPGMGTIADWKPVSYNPTSVRVPHYLPIRPVVRQEVAALYTAISRLDQGVGLVQKELQSSGQAHNTLVMFSSVGGVPFPRAHNDLHETGMAMPLMVSSPQQHTAQRTNAVVSTFDLLPTVLDWFGVPLATSPSLPPPKLTGKSLLPLLANPANITAYSRAFASHNFDEVTMSYPMRVIRTPQYRLIHNLNFHAPFPVSPVMARSPTFLDIVNNTLNDQTTGWFQSLARFYFRDQWELYDTDYDVYEIENDAGDPAHSGLKKSLAQELQTWLVMTQDPWRCLPSEVLMEDGSCLDAGNMEP